MTKPTTADVNTGSTVPVNDASTPVTRAGAGILKAEGAIKASRHCAKRALCFLLMLSLLPTKKAKAATKKK
jgi:hypothetical protein